MRPNAAGMRVRSRKSKIAPKFRMSDRNQEGHVHLNLLTNWVLASYEATESSNSGIGAKLRDNNSDGQVSAGIATGKSALLAAENVACKLSVPCGSTLPASHMHLLFRTPSFRGQVCVPHISLSAVFFLPFSYREQQLSAHYRMSQMLLLNNNDGLYHLPPTTIRRRKGQNKCESRNSCLLRRPARVSQRVATPSVNRRCLVAARELWAQQWSVPTRYWARWSAPQAMCFTAKHRTLVDNPEFLRARAVAPSDIKLNAVAGVRSCNGALRFPNTKTKDVSCSKRS